jgi:dolichol-phosphate mannosyltransferase
MKSNQISFQNGNGHNAVTILVPTLNEVENIDALAERILVAIKGAEFSAEIMIIDGGSKDGTQEKVKKWNERAPVRLVQSDGKGGLSGDILFGALQARTDVVVVMDADLSHPPEVLPSLIRPVRDGTHDMAIGSRYIPGGAMPGWPWTRKVTSKVATYLAWPLVSINDPMSGFFAVRRERLLSLAKEAAGFKIALELVARGDDSMRIIEVPITFVDRERGTSKFGAKEIVTCLRQMLMLAGGAVSVGNALRFAAVGSMGVVVDYTIFSLLLSLGAGIALSHITSFIGATIFNYFFNARWAFAQTAGFRERSQWRMYLSFLTFCVLALLFRGAVLAVLTESIGWSPYIAIFFAIAAATIINFVGSAFFVFPRQTGRSTRALRLRFFSLCVVSYAVLLRLSFMSVINLIPEEAYYWSYAQHIDIGYLDHPPMVAWLIWFGTHLLGNSEMGVRLPGLLCWLVMALFMYKLTKNLLGKTTAFVTLMLLSVLPVYFFSGFFMMPDAPLYAAWAGYLYFLERGLLAGKRQAWVGVGVCLGLGMLSKYTIALLVPAAAVLVLVDRESRKWLVRPEPYLALIVAFALFSPVIIWNAQNDWISFAFQGPRRWSGRIHFSLHILVGEIIALLTPVGVIGMLCTVVPRWSPKPLSEDMAFDRLKFFSMFLALIPLSVFVIYSLQKQPRVNWTGPVWLSLIPLLALGVFPGGPTKITGWFASFSQRVWMPTVAILLVLFGSSLYFIETGMPGAGLTHAMKIPMTWEEIGKEVKDLGGQVKAETGIKPMIVGTDRYRVASELSFYGFDPAITESIAGRHLVGGDSLMWSRWFLPSEAKGKPVLLIGLEPGTLADDLLKNYFDTMGPIRVRDVVKNRKVVAIFYYRIGYGYKP